MFVIPGYLDSTKKNIRTIASYEMTNINISQIRIWTVIRVDLPSNSDSRKY